MHSENLGAKLNATLGAMLVTSTPEHRPLARLGGKAVSDAGENEGKAAPHRQGKGSTLGAMRRKGGGNTCQP